MLLSVLSMVTLTAVLLMKAMVAAGVGKVK
jgi:hypothetical protein